MFKVLNFSKLFLFNYADLQKKYLLINCCKKSFIGLGSNINNKYS